MWVFPSCFGLFTLALGKSLLPQHDDTFNRWQQKNNNNHHVKVQYFKKVSSLLLTPRNRTPRCHCHNNPNEKYPACPLTFRFHHICLWISNKRILARNVSKFLTAGGFSASSDALEGGVDRSAQHSYPSWLHSDSAAVPASCGLLPQVWTLQLPTPFFWVDQITKENVTFLLICLCVVFFFFL